MCENNDIDLNSLNNLNLNFEKYYKKLSEIAGSDSNLKWILDSYEVQSINRENNGEYKIVNRTFGVKEIKERFYKPYFIAKQLYEQTKGNENTIFTNLREKDSVTYGTQTFFENNGIEYIGRIEEESSGKEYIEYKHIDDDNIFKLEHKFAIVNRTFVNNDYQKDREIYQEEKNKLVKDLNNKVNLISDTHGSLLALGEFLVNNGAKFKEDEPIIMYYNLENGSVINIDELINKSPEEFIKYRAILNLEPDESFKEITTHLGDVTDKGFYSDESLATMEYFFRQVKDKNMNNFHWIVGNHELNILINDTKREFNSNFAGSATFSPSKEIKSRINSGEFVKKQDDLIHKTMKRAFMHNEVECVNVLNNGVVISHTFSKAPSLFMEKYLQRIKKCKTINDFLNELFSEQNKKIIFKNIPEMINDPEKKDEKSEIEKFLEKKLEIIFNEEEYKKIKLYLEDSQRIQNLDNNLDNNLDKKELREKVFELVNGLFIIFVLSSYLPEPEKNPLYYNITLTFFSSLELDIIQPSKRQLDSIIEGNIFGHLGMDHPHFFHNGLFCIDSGNGNSDSQLPLENNEYKYREIELSKSGIKVVETKLENEKINYEIRQSMNGKNDIEEKRFYVEEDSNTIKKAKLFNNDRYISNSKDKDEEISKVVNRLNKDKIIKISNNSKAFSGAGGIIKQNMKQLETFKKYRDRFTENSSRFKCQENEKVFKPRTNKKYLKLINDINEKEVQNQLFLSRLLNYMGCPTMFSYVNKKGEILSEYIKGDKCRNSDNKNDEQMIKRNMMANFFGDKDAHSGNIMQTNSGTKKHIDLDFNNKPVNTNFSVGRIMKAHNTDAGDNIVFYPFQSDEIQKCGDKLEFVRDEYLNLLRKVLLINDEDLNFITAPYSYLNKRIKTTYKTENIEQNFKKSYRGYQAKAFYWLYKQNSLARLFGFSEKDSNFVQVEEKLHKLFCIENYEYKEENFFNQNQYNEEYNFIKLSEENCCVNFVKLINLFSKLLETSNYNSVTDLFTRNNEIDFGKILNESETPEDLIEKVNIIVSAVSINQTEEQVIQNNNESKEENSTEVNNATETDEPVTKENTVIQQDKKENQKSNTPEDLIEKVNIIVSAVSTNQTEEQVIQNNNESKEENSTEANNVTKRKRRKRRKRKRESTPQPINDDTTEETLQNYYTGIKNKVNDLVKRTNELENKYKTKEKAIKDLEKTVKENDNSISLNKLKNKIENTDKKSDIAFFSLSKQVKLNDLIDDENFNKSVLGKSGFGGKIKYNKNNNKINISFDKEKFFLQQLNILAKVDKSYQELLFTLNNEEINLENFGNIKDETIKNEFFIMMKINPAKALIRLLNKTDIKISLAKNNNLNDINELLEKLKETFTIISYIKKADIAVQYYDNRENKYKPIATIIKDVIKNIKNGEGIDGNLLSNLGLDGKNSFIETVKYLTHLMYAIADKKYRVGDKYCENKLNLLLKNIDLKTANNMFLSDNPLIGFF